MRLPRILLLTATHGAIGLLGFALGIYLLPILIAPPAPSESDISAKVAQAAFTTNFRRDLQDSDMLHWGEGKVSVGPKHVALVGELAPGPDYRLYFSPAFVETEDDFKRLKPQMVQAGHVKTFENFLVKIPPGLDPAQYNSVIVWCETFEEFITAGQYR